MKIKKVWITPYNKDEDIVSLTLESENPLPLYKRISISDMVFPNNPSENNPLRHTISLGLFDFDDLEKIRNTIDQFLNSL